MIRPYPYFWIFLLFVSASLGIDSTSGSHRTQQPINPIHFPKRGEGRKTFVTGREGKLWTYYVEPHRDPHARLTRTGPVAMKFERNGDEFLAWIRGNAKTAVAMKPRTHSVTTDMVDENVAADPEPCLTCGSHLECEDGQINTGGKCVPIVTIP